MFSKKGCRHVNMQPIKTMHNVWLQQLETRGSCLYVTMVNKYVQAFKQTKLYYLFKKGGHFGQVPDWNDLFLQRATMFCDLIQLADVIQKYVHMATMMSKVIHLKGEEIFGSYKWKLDLLPWL